MVKPGPEDPLLVLSYIITLFQNTVVLQGCHHGVGVCVVFESATEFYINRPIC